MTPDILAVLLFSLSLAHAAPTHDSPAGLSIPLRVRSPATTRDPIELGRIAKSQRDALAAKYSAQPNRKRSSGYNLIVDQGYDSGYYGTLAIGTPLTSFDVVLDTGSSDFWVAGDTCSSGCRNTPMFNPSSSSTFKNLSTSFNVVYGSGQVVGYLGQDIVEMAGFSVANQGLGVVNVVSSALLQPPVSGILGLAWQSIATSGQSPFWQTLASSGALDSPLFAVQLRRYSNASDASVLEPGGQLTFGYTNSSLYTGEIDYVDIPGAPSYWYLTLSSLTVQGNAISLSSGSTAAIDTGTTNIAGPAAAIAAIYAQIPNSSPGSGQWNGYYIFPCDTQVTVTMSFGGKNWTMSAADFTFSSISSNECIGVFFETLSTNSNSNTPSWIIGDAFLKNVYSVFRYNPASIGFAALSGVAIAQNGVNGAVPTPTIGTISATVTNTSGAAPRVQLGLGRGAVQTLMAGLLVTMVLWVL